MSPFLQTSFPLFLILFVILLFDSCHCTPHHVHTNHHYHYHRHHQRYHHHHHHHHHHQMHHNSTKWSIARATWYGDPNGCGSTGGACGFKEAVDKAPYNKMISAGGPSLYKSGKGCGTCYKVRCSQKLNAACSGHPVTVVITDECPGCTQDAVHFDLSGSAFGALALPGQADKLRNAGRLAIQYRKAQCQHYGRNVAFKVDAGSNPYYLSFLVEYGDVASVEVKQASGSWTAMQRSWGAEWQLNAGSGLSSPLSVRITLESGKKIIAKDVIPNSWQAGQTYKTTIGGLWSYLT